MLLIDFSIIVGWTCKRSRQLSGVAAATGTASGPELPGLATPVVDIDGTVQVSAATAGSLATAAGVPVVVVDLPAKFRN